MTLKMKIRGGEQDKLVITERLRLAGLLATLLLVLVSWRIFDLQVVQHEHYTTLSQSNRVKVVPIPPTRGLIFSSDGVLLADNRPSFSLEVTPEKAGNLDTLLLRLGEIMQISETAVTQFRARLKQKRRFESVPLIYNLSDEEVARISVDLHRYPGVDIVARLNRYYPLGPVTSHTIGYVGMIDEDELQQVDRSNYTGTTHIGKIGVEKAFEDLLHGDVGYQQVEVNAQGRVVRVLDRTPPRPGKNIYLSLNAALQNLAMQSMEDKRGAVVALDPASGQVLAMVSTPGYDPNLFVNGIDTKTYRHYLNSPDTPLLNRALQGKYPPGSTIKPMLGLAALGYGIRRIEDQTWCPGWYTLKGTSLRKGDWKKEGHGHTSLRKAIAESCDVYFYVLANEMGIDRIHESMTGFGFGQRTAIDIGGESPGLLPSREWKRRTRNEAWYPGETLNIGIGQGAILATPVQLAVATAAIASQGRVLKPQLFSEARDALTNEVVATATPELQRHITASESDWEQIIASMVDVVHASNGTARRMGQGADYTIAGKSGTAQVFSLARDEKYDAASLAKELHDHALFVAFAPAENPRIAVSVIIENGGGGSTAAAPIARKIFDTFMEQERARSSLADQPDPDEAADLL